MSNEVRWTKLILDTFIAEACLTKEEEMIMRTRVAGWSRTRLLNTLCSNTTKGGAKPPFYFFEKVSKYMLT